MAKVGVLAVIRAVDVARIDGGEFCDHDVSLLVVGWRSRRSGGQGQDGVKEGPKFRAARGGNPEVMIAEDRRAIADFRKGPLSGSGEEKFGEVPGWRLVVFTVSGWADGDFRLLPANFWIVGQYGNSQASNSYWAACG